MLAAGPHRMMMCADLLGDTISPIVFRFGYPVGDWSLMHFEPHSWLVDRFSFVRSFFLSFLSLFLFSVCVTYS